MVSDASSPAFAVPPQKSQRETGARIVADAVAALRIGPCELAVFLGVDHTTVTFWMSGREECNPPPEVMRFLEKAIAHQIRLERCTECAGKGHLVVGAWPGATRDAVSVVSTGTNAPEVGDLRPGSSSDEDDDMPFELLDE